MSVDIKKRLDRIVEILIQMQSKRVVRAQELADRFDVSLRTIYRDIRSLEQAGVPLIGEAGMGYSLMEGYRLPPVSFTKEEALSFVAVEKLAEKFLDEASAAIHASAMMKIKAILKSQELDLVNHTQDQIIMRKQGSPIFQEKVPHVLSYAIESIANKKQVQIDYQGIKDDRPQLRTIEPIGIIHEIGFWYIVAFCIEKQDFRQFRSDRINRIQLTKTPFSTRHMTIGEYLEAKAQPEAPKVRAIIRVKPEYSSYLRWQRNYYGLVDEIKHADHIEMHFDVKDIKHEFPRWLLMFGDMIEIAEPQILRDNFINLLREISLKHEPKNQSPL